MAEDAGSKRSGGSKHSGGSKLSGGSKHSREHGKHGRRVDTFEEAPPEASDSLPPPPQPEMGEDVFAEDGMQVVDQQVIPQEFVGEEDGALPPQAAGSDGGWAVGGFAEDEPADDSDF
jgi:hypothetical protein